MADKIKVIVVDFDGTLRNKDTGAPVDAMVKRMRQWYSEGHEVCVLTEDDAWLEEHGLDYFMRTGSNIDTFDEFWSSRAVQVEANTGRRLVPIKGYGAGAV